MFHKEYVQAALTMQETGRQFITLAARLQRHCWFGLYQSIVNVPERITIMCEADRAGAESIIPNRCLHFPFIYKFTLLRPARTDRYNGALSCQHTVKHPARTPFHLALQMASNSLQGSWCTSSTAAHGNLEHSGNRLASAPTHTQQQPVTLRPTDTPLH